MQDRGDTYHRHFFLEVIQVPALLAFALLGRALVIFLVLRGGDTIAVRATRLRARRGSRGTLALPALALILASSLHRWVEAVSQDFHLLPEASHLCLLSLPVIPTTPQSLPCPFGLTVYVFL
jgi:hypothetical protein